jgi:hypothetical protein
MSIHLLSARTLSLLATTRAGAAGPSGTNLAQPSTGQPLPQRTRRAERPLGRTTEAG